MTDQTTSTYHALVSNHRDPDGHYVAEIYRGDEWVKVLVERDRDALVRRCKRWVAHLQRTTEDRTRIEL